MKIAIFKLASISALLGASFAVSAHEAVGTLAADYSAIDVYHTSCFTWSAAGAAAAGESAAASKRFVAQIHKQCTTNNAACNAPAGTLKITIGSPFGQKTTGNVVIPNGLSATTATTGTGVQDNRPAPEGTGLWLSGAIPTGGSPWIQIADLLGTDATGTYTFAITHNVATAMAYQASIHCEDLALGSVPLPSTAAHHSGTGVNGSAAAGWIDVPNNSGTTAGDYNLFIHQ